MLTSVEWENVNDVTLPLNRTTPQIVEYTRGTTGEIDVLDMNFITDVKLAIHGSTGAQLANLPNKVVKISGVTWTCNDNVVSAIGETSEVASTTVSDIYCNIPIKPGTYYIARGGDGIVVFVRVINKTGSTTHYYSTEFNLDGSEQSVILFLQVNANTKVDGTVKVMLNKGDKPLPFEPYTSGTPYTDKYTATITDQTEDNVTLSIKNVSATVGDTTTLDVVLTDRNGVTKRSEQGKKFIGG